MFGKTKNKAAVTIEKEAARKLIHDLRASHHAARLNADAANLLAAKLDGAEAARLKKVLAFLMNDLDKFKSQLDHFTQVVKGG